MWVFSFKLLINNALLIIYISYYRCWNADNKLQCTDADYEHLLYKQSLILLQKKSEGISKDHAIDSLHFNIPRKILSVSGEPQCSSGLMFSLEMTGRLKLLKLWCFQGHELFWSIIFNSLHCQFMIVIYILFIILWFMDHYIRPICS